MAAIQSTGNLGIDKQFIDISKELLLHAIVTY